MLDRSVEDFPSLNDFCRNKVVFLTGGTGFIGKCLVEKLLRTSEVREVIILVRPKRNLTPEARLRVCFTVPLFDVLKESCPYYLDKIKIVEGKLEDLAFGLKAEDRNYIIENAQILIHNAATVRFDDPVRETLKTNVVGTKTMIELAEEIHNLESFIYVSTAYSNAYTNYIEEKVYSPAFSVTKILKEIDQPGFEDSLQSMSRKWPNAYSFSKALAEQLLKEQDNRLPISIIRPSIVIASNKDPIPGWVDSISGGNGMLIAWSKGVLRVTKVDLDVVVDVIPVDIVVSSIIAVALKTAAERNNRNGTISSVKVYNCVSSTQNPVTFGFCLKFWMQVNAKYPILSRFWVPSTFATKSEIMYKVLKTIFHLLPARAFDMIGGVVGSQKSVVDMYEKIHKFQDNLSFFTMKEFQFEARNMMDLHRKMSAEERRCYPVDVNAVQWKSFMFQMYMGMRKNFFKENLDNLLESRRKYSQHIIIHYSLISILSMSSIYLIAFCLYSYLLTFLM